MTTRPNHGGVGREAFLDRVRAVLGRNATTKPEAAAPVIDEAIARVTQRGADTVTRFADRAAKVGMCVHRTQEGLAVEQTLALLATLAAKRVAVAASPRLAGVASAVQIAGIDLSPWQDAGSLEPLYPLDAGVTDVQAAIAETGTLVCWSGPGRGRGLSLVPPLHIAIVRASDIVPDLIDYLTRHAAHGPQDLPSSIVFITGPSKTADIEGVLITGVHGPREVHIILIDDG